MQICCTVFAPSFMTAGMFIIFGKIITQVGGEYSRLEPKHSDVAALVVQSIGGAKASAADTLEAANKGAKTMVVGIIMQMVAITIYVVIQLEFVIRVVKNKPVRRVQRDEIETATPEEKGKAVTGAEGGEDIELPARPGISRKTWLMLLGLVLSTVLIYVRSIYRTIELLDGWHGPIITKEKLFDLLDGMPIVLAMVSLNIFHPGRLI
ncbi:hypothetical protein FRB99_002635 [Tulasnella sp. 403]|nr:hypothetical protein FRB99_002635 [Tulasnella sp. 403]